MSHTPGPWAAIFHETATGKPFGIIVGGKSSNGLMDTVICHGPDFRDESIGFKAFQAGNASVLAAAPSLLSAIKRLASAAQNRENTMGDQCALFAAQAELRDATKVAIAAIAAAENNSTPPNTNEG